MERQASMPSGPAQLKEYAAHADRMVKEGLVMSNWLALALAVIVMMLIDRFLFP